MSQTSGDEFQYRLSSNIICDCLIGKYHEIYVCQSKSFVENEASYTFSTVVGSFKEWNNQTDHSTGSSHGVKCILHNVPICTHQYSNDQQCSIPLHSYYVEVTALLPDQPCSFSVGVAEFPIQGNSMAISKVQASFICTVPMQ